MRNPNQRSTWLSQEEPVGVQLGNHGAVGDVERREQVDHTVPGVVVGPPLRHTRHHRQYRLGTVQRL